MSEIGISKKPRILFMVDFFTPHLGWLEVVFENIINRLLEKGYEIGVVTIRHIPTLPAYELNGNLQIRRVGRSRVWFLRHWLWLGLKVARYYDLIHATTYASAIPSSIIWRLRGLPTILTVHEIFGRLWRRYKPHYRRFYLRFEQIIFWFHYTYKVCVSHYTKTMLHSLYKVPNKDLQVITNWIDTDVWDLKNENKQWIKAFRERHGLDGYFIGLYYGHSWASKWLDYLIRAIPAVFKEFPDFKVILNIIPGKRDYQIFKLISKVQSNKNVILLHGLQQTDLVNLVCMSDFVIVPSISDGFWLVAAEVSQLKKHLIVSRNGALPEVVSWKVVFLRNLTPEAFVEAVWKIKSGQREEIPHKEFQWEETVREYEEIYNKCLN